MDITAQMVKTLREKTGSGMMQCKKALVAANGNMDDAVDALRKAGEAQAVKKGNRIAAEGTVIALTDNNNAAMIEINTETDFVARDDNFKQFASSVAGIVLENSTDDLNKIADLIHHDDQTIEQARQSLINTIGENIQLRRAMTLSSDNPKAAYVHGSKIAVLVELDGGDEALAKDIAMHVAALNPTNITAEEVDPALIEKEKDIFTAQAKDSGKPAEIIEKMIQGRVRKFLQEITLVGQPFVKDPSQTVGQLLNAHNASVLRAVRFEVGEGIEKEDSDFVKEVQEQMRGA